MPHTESQIARLLLKRLSAPLSDEEETILQDWRQQPGNESLYQKMLKPGVLLTLVQEFEAAKEQAASVAAPKLPSMADRTVHRVHFMRRWGWAAASVLVILSIGAYFWFYNKEKEPSVISSNVEEIQPGKEGAILTLADNSQVSLDTIQNGVLALQGGATAKVVNGKLIYEVAGDEVVYNTMSTPKGRQFHFTLADGTGVWLNSASSIRYPTVFGGKERRVEITGEAYFEVVKNKKIPFRVNVNNQAEVEVLGTQFNVNSYNNEATINTTLIEGSVRLQPLADGSDKTQPEISNNRTVVLAPGQQAQMQAQPGTIKVVNDADIEKVMAWKNGVFDFNDITFDDAMRQLERWYDIEVIYEKSIPTDIELNGKITKDVTLNDLLFALGKVGVRCRLDGRRLLVSS